MMEQNPCIMSWRWHGRGGAWEQGVVFPTLDQAFVLDLKWALSPR